MINLVLVYNTPSKSARTPTSTLSPAFSCAFGGLLVADLSIDGPLVIFVAVICLITLVMIKPNLLEMCPRGYRNNTYRIYKSCGIV